jgi:hypothetical protein
LILRRKDNLKLKFELIVSNFISDAVFTDGFKHGEQVFLDDWGRENQGIYMDSRGSSCHLAIDMGMRQ